MPISRLAAVVLALAFTPCLVAAQEKTFTHSEFNINQGLEGRPYVLVLNSAVRTVDNAWGPGQTLVAYAHSHPGSYIVFADNGTLFRLENPERLAEAEAIYKPMEALNVQQAQLSAAQAPLGQLQRTLAGKMKTATTPEEMGRIGGEQGRIGEQQGKIGQEQGRIGRQQGEIGRALHTRVQGMIEECLGNHTCTALQTTAATR